MKEGGKNLFSCQRFYSSGQNILFFYLDTLQKKQKVETQQPWVVPHFLVVCIDLIPSLTVMKW